MPGNATISNVLSIATLAGSTGVYTLTGGTLTANIITIGNNGTFNRLGGVLAPGYTVILGGTGTWNGPGGPAAAATDRPDTAGEAAMTSSVFNQDGGAINGIFENDGTYNYSGGAFNLVNSGVANLNAPFNAGQGIQNTGSINIAGGGNNTLKVSALSIDTANGATFGLPDNKLIVVGGDVGTAGEATYSALTGLIQSAHNGGAWDCPGITTSMTDAIDGLTALGIATADQAGYGGSEFGGVSVAGNDVLLMYTYAGDANLDGFISGDDYSSLDFHIAVPGASGWYNGDFNYDGIISGDDYSVIDFNILAQGAPFPTAGAGGGGEGAQLVDAVPEPAGVAGCAGVALLTSSQRGRRRRA